MSTILSITPSRFIASGGKLDTDNRYLFRDDLGSFLRMPLPTERLGMVRTDNYGRIIMFINDVTIDPPGTHSFTYTNTIPNPPQTVGLRI